MRRVASWWVLVPALCLEAWGCAAKHGPAVAPAEGQKAATKRAPGPAAAQVRTQPVTARPLHGELDVVGSVAYDQDHYAIVGPQVTGRVVALHARLGDLVRAGQMLAEIESPEVGRATSEYVATEARAAAALANLRREEALHARNISSAREFEVARAQAAVEGAAHRAAGQQLEALGVRLQDLKDRAQGGSRVVLRAPFAATVTARREALGESVGHGTDAFVLADLDHLWALLDVYERDLSRLCLGQRVLLRAESLPSHTFEATLSYVDMRVDPQNRTASVRVNLDNKNGLLRPGQFVSARLLDDPAGSPEPVLTVPRRAVQVVDARTLVFVRQGEDFVPQQVVLGRADRDDVEVREGLQPGAQVVVEGAFLLKSTHFR